MGRDGDPPVPPSCGTPEGVPRHAGRQTFGDGCFGGRGGFPHLTDKDDPTPMRARAGDPPRTMPQKILAGRATDPQLRGDVVQVKVDQVILSRAPIPRPRRGPGRRDEEDARRDRRRLRRHLHHRRRLARRRRRGLPLLRLARFSPPQHPRRPPWHRLPRARPPGAVRGPGPARPHRRPSPRHRRRHRHAGAGGLGGAARAGAGHRLGVGAPSAQRADPPLRPGPPLRHAPGTSPSSSSAKDLDEVVRRIEHEHRAPVVLEFAGPSARLLSVPERAVLCGIAPQVGAAAATLRQRREDRGLPPRPAPLQGAPRARPRPRRPVRRGRSPSTSPPSTRS